MEVRKGVTGPGYDLALTELAGEGGIRYVVDVATEAGAALVDDLECAPAEPADLTGDHAERWQLWDSCFDPGFTDLHGGDVRASAKSRYRQWLTHSSAPGTTSSTRPAAWAAAGASSGARSEST